MKTLSRLFHGFIIISTLSVALWAPGALAQQKPKPKKETLVDYIWVSKKTSTLYLIKNKQILHKYDVAFGSNPVGHKAQEGDERTPEGTYSIVEKRTYSNFYKAVLISYPNADDSRRARANKLNPGGNILIHGIPNDFKFLPESIQQVQSWFNWTNGCIAVTNAEMDQIYNLIHTGIPIVITPRDR